MSELESIVLAGQPNCGKTSLFNALTGTRAKVGNYPGVTVERKEGWLLDSSGQKLSVLDLPGTYSLEAKTPDERVARDVLLGRIVGEKLPQVIVAVVDATHLERGLSFVLELKRLGRPMVLALNMMDLAKRRGLELSLEAMSAELGMPVVPTVAVKREGLSELIAQARAALGQGAPVAHEKWSTIPERFQIVDEILKRTVTRRVARATWTERLDRLLLHPVWGLVFFLLVITVLFQSIFTWAEVPKEMIESGLGELGKWLATTLGPGALTSLLVDGVIAGTGAVLVFLPQILILFTFILLLEDSGYMARAAFLMDYWMGKVGLHGRAFIPLLSSYACAIPGIMATRTIENPRDRLATILVAPLTTCSARLPVYSLLVGAFVPATPIAGPLTLQGLTLLGLYALGIVSALIVAWALRRTVLRGPKPPLLLELPSYKRPGLRSVGLALLDRARSFVERAGTVILGLSVLIWFLSSYPAPPADPALLHGEPAIAWSYAGRIGKFLEPLVAPLGFNWRIAVALIPGFAAREVMVGALATVYAVESAPDSLGDAGVDKLGSILSSQWSVATALSLLVWYVFACQCISTLAVVRRETGGWKWSLVMLGYMTALAYVMSWFTYHLAVALGAG